MEAVGGSSPHRTPGSLKAIAGNRSARRAGQLAANPGCSGDAVTSASSTYRQLAAFGVRSDRQQVVGIRDAGRVCRLDASAPRRNHRRVYPELIGRQTWRERERGPDDDGAQVRCVDARHVCRLVSRRPRSRCGGSGRGREGAQSIDCGRTLGRLRDAVQHGLSRCWSTLVIRVGVAGFEPTASSSRTKRATKLRHTPLEAPTAYRTALSADQTAVRQVTSRRKIARTRRASRPGRPDPGPAR